MTLLCSYAPSEGDYGKSLKHQLPREYSKEYQNKGLKCIDVQLLKLLIAVAFGLKKQFYCQQTMLLQATRNSTHLKSHNSFLVNHESGVMLENCSGRRSIWKIRYYLILENVVCRKS